MLAAPPVDWGKQSGRPRITQLMSTFQQNLKHQGLTPSSPEIVDTAQNRPLWRMLSTYGATRS